MLTTARDSSLFLAGTLVGVAIATCILLRWQQRDAPSAGQKQTAVQHGDGLDLEDEVIKEQLSRNVAFFGQDAMDALCKSSYVIVVGLGGVGAHASHLLLRSGVSRLRLVDFDQVTVSSLNRHAVATRADVGLPKATVLAEHLRHILPEAKIEAQVCMFTAETEEAVLGGDRAPDFVLDAIDNVDTKVHLLAACHRRGLRVLCVGGAGAKADPTKLRFVDIQEASCDPLVRAVRHRLRTQHGIHSGVPVLLSTERPRCGLVTTDEQQTAADVRAFQTIPNFRIRTIPVLGTVPAIFGMAAASWILCQLANAPFFPDPIFQIRRPQYETLLEELQNDELALCGHCEDVAVDLEEVMFLVANVWRGVSATQLGLGDSGRDKGLHRRTAGLRLGRWRLDKPCVPANLVLLTEEELRNLRAVGHAAWCTAQPQAAAFAEETLARVSAIFGAAA